MTFEEAKKLLKKEFVVIGFHKSTEPFEFDESRWFAGEKPEVLDAFRVLAKEGYYVAISGHDYMEREKRLKEEYEKNTKTPGSGEEQPKEKKGIIYPTTFPKADFYYKHVLNEGNPALKEAASQFNDALLDEQAKKIKRLGKEIARLNKIIHDKNAVLSDVAEELRLSKIREKNLTEVCQKYMKENEELKKELDVAKKQNTAVMVDMTAKCFRAARESINDVFESYAAKYAKSTLDDLKEKAYESFNAKACKLGLAGSKDGNGILDQMVWVDKAEEGGDHSAIIVQCYKDITTISKDEAEIIERCTKNGTELHYSEKDGFTYTNMYGEEMPIICLRGMFQVFTDEEIKNMKK